MKYKNLIILLVVAVIGCKNEEKNNPKIETEHNHTQSEPKSENKKTLSPHTSEMAMIGDAHIHIDYSSPGVRDRIIFGGTVGLRPSLAGWCPYGYLVGNR